MRPHRVRRRVERVLKLQEQIVMIVTEVHSRGKRVTLLQIEVMGALTIIVTQITQII